MPISVGKKLVLATHLDLSLGLKSFAMKINRMDNPNMLQAIFVEATIGIIVVDAKGEIVDLNPYAEKLFGYQKTELLQKKVEVLMPASFRKGHTSYRDRYHKKPIPRSMGANLELFGQRKNGLQFPIEISLSSMEVDGQRFSIAYVSDDTPRREAMEALRERKTMLDEAQRIAHIGSFEMDVTTGICTWSKEMYQIFGLDKGAENLSYEEHLLLVHPEDQALVRNYHERIKKEKRGFDFGYRIISKDKGLRFVEGKRDVKLDETGAVTKIFGLLQDVTELKEAQSISEDVSKIMEESLNEIFIFDAVRLNFLQVNKGARQNIGYSLEEMKKMTPIDIKPEFDEESFLAVIEPLKKGEKDILIFETIHQRKNQSTYPVEVHLQFSRIGKQDVYVAFILNILERKKYEQKIIEYSSQLEEKVRARTQELQLSEAKLKSALAKEMELGKLKSRFVSMASHEFRTPLSSILSSASLIGRYEKEAQQANRMKHVNRISSSVKNLSSILNDFLSLEKIESGRIRNNPIALDFKEFIQQVLDELSLITKEGQKIIHQHTGALTVIGDEHLLKNILINLLSNGIKYSPANKNVELNTHYENKVLTIEVKDYGIGIPKEDQVHMFTRFFRADNVANIQGTGLGLTIVKRYLDLVDGAIHFESKENEGTSFFVRIPK